jgi:hypothetical protein
MPCWTALALCCWPGDGLLAWRTAVGGINAFDSHSGTMMLGFPEWMVYVAMVPPMVLTAVIGAGPGRSGVSDEGHA